MRFFDPMKNVFICDGDHNKAYYYDEIVKILKNAKPEQIVLFEDVNKYLDEGKKRGFVTVGISNGFGKEEVHGDFTIDATKAV